MNAASRVVGNGSPVVMSNTSVGATLSARPVARLVPAISGTSITGTPPRPGASTSATLTLCATGSGAITSPSAFRRSASSASIAPTLALTSDAAAAGSHRHSPIQSGPPVDGDMIIDSRSGSSSSSSSSSKPNAFSAHGSGLHQHRQASRLHDAAGMFICLNAALICRGRHLYSMPIIKAFDQTAFSKKARVKCAFSKRHCMGVPFHKRQPEILPCRLASWAQRLDLHGT